MASRKKTVPAAPKVKPHFDELFVEMHSMAVKLNRGEIRHIDYSAKMDDSLSRYGWTKAEYFAELKRRKQGGVGIAPVRH